jgi:hypothetical protein
MGEITIKDLLEAGVHFGHQTKRWNPKMKPFLFAEKNGIHIIDLEKTMTCLNAAREAVREVATSGKPVLFVGTKPQAKKLDPIRESEGVGRGTVAFGRGATKLMKDLGVTGPASIVVNVDGKVQLVTTGATPADLDARDAKVKAAVAAIKEYVSTPDGPKTAKPGDKFALSMSIKLASWLAHSDKTPRELKITVPPDIKCDATQLKGDQIKVADKLLTATVTCSGPRGIYEARGELRFGYDAPGGGTGVGAESTDWKFEIKN